MKILLIACGLTIAMQVGGADVVIKPVDKYGNVQHHKDGWVQKGDRLYQVDKYGNIQYHRVGFKIVEKKRIPVDKYGNKE